MVISIPRMVRFAGAAVALPALAAISGCALEHRHEFLEHQYLVRDLDNSLASQQRLEQEYLREQAHVNRLTEEVGRLMDREEALALEASDWEYMVFEAEDELAALREQKAAVDAATAATKAALEAPPPSGDGPKDPEAIRARIAVLLAEVEALTRQLAEGATPATPEPAPVVTPEPAAPPEGGGG